MQNRTRRMVRIAMFVALTAAGAFIKIPVPPVPISMQSLVAIFAGVLLGAKDGMLSQLIYLALGLMGLPVFAGGGGLGYVLKPSFGFVVGFAVCAWVAGALTHRSGEVSGKRVLGASLAATAALYAVGLPYMYGILNYVMGAGKSLSWVLMNGFVLFVPGDFSKCLAAALMSPVLLPILRRMGYAPSGK